MGWATATLSYMDARRTLAGLAVGALALAIAGCGDDADDPGDAAPTSDETTTTESSEPEAPAETTTTQAPAPDVPEPVCVYSGTDPDFGYMQVELTFTNPLGDVPDLEVTYALLGGDGSRVFTGTAGGLDLQDIHFPSEGEQFRLSVDSREEPPPGLDAATAGCSVLGIEEGTDIGGYERATAADTCEVVGTDSPNGPDVTVSITSPYADTTDVQVWWALRGPGGVRFDTSTEVIDLVGGGEAIQFTENSLTGPPPEWAIGDVTCDVVGFWNHGG